MVPRIGKMVNCKWAAEEGPVLPSQMCQDEPERGSFINQTWGLRVCCLITTQRFGLFPSMYYYILALKPAPFQNLAHIVETEKGERTYSYLDLVRTPKMRKLAMLTGATWYGIILHKPCRWYSSCPVPYKLHKGWRKHGLKCFSLSGYSCVK